MATNHYTITQKQFIILKLLYRFRFISSDLVAKTTGIQKSTINKRLQLLVELRYIGRRYEPNYHLLRKHASYYLLTEGIKALKALPGTKYSPAILRNINKDKQASDQFIDHSLDVYGVYCVLRDRYGNDMQFFTRSQLAGLDHFPKKLPDAYIQLGRGSDKKHFFLDVLHEGQPFFLSTRKVIQYIDYARKADWSITNTELPKILLICDSPALQKRLTKRMSRVIADIDDQELKFFTAVLGELSTGTAWRNMADADESGD
jgi:DNA-binding HxlR family transcriptional regulator